MEALPSGVPWTLYLFSILLSGGVGAAILQYLGIRANNKAQKSTTGAEARLKDVTALGDALTSLATENERLIARVRGLDERNVVLETNLDECEAQLRSLRAK